MSSSQAASTVEALEKNLEHPALRAATTLTSLQGSRVLDLGHDHLIVDALDMQELSEGSARKGSGRAAGLHRTYVYK